MFRLLAATSLFLLSLSPLASSTSSCITFDDQWNLLAFNFGGKDYDVGKQDVWGQSLPPTDITVTGRPSFNGPNVSCYFSQFTNAIYVLGADSSNPAAIYIYDATAKSWSTQSVNAGEFDPGDFAAILDHDTNVFYAYSKGRLFSLDMQLLKVANATTQEWASVEQVDWDTTTYRPTMALANNHIHFLGVPGLPDGNAKIFVIHFAFMQPDPQPYGNFPNVHGQTASFFKETGVQTMFAFIPDDASQTYVIDVTTNKTQTLKGPTNKDPGASYSASTSALVQLGSSGLVSYMAFDQGAEDKNVAAEWAPLPIAVPSASLVSNTSPSPTLSGTAGVQSVSPTLGSSTNNTVTRNGGFLDRCLWVAAALLVGVVLSF